MPFKEEVKTKRKSKLVSRLLLVVAVLMLAAGIYMLILVLSPKQNFAFPIKKIDISKVPVDKGDRVIVPEIGVNLPIKTGGPEALNDAAWHRYPERGDPVKGGNFILSAHRFVIGLTPGETRRKSPFYNAGKLNVGDDIFVDFKGKRYDYKITEKMAVKPTQVSIEDPSKEAKLTLYTCTLGGQNDGRDVFIAKLSKQ